MRVATVLIEILCFISTCLFFKYLWNRRWLYYYAWKAPGPTAWPIIGNALWFYTGSEDLMAGIKILIKRYNHKLFRLWMGNRLYFVITNPNDIQLVTKHCLDKDEYYNIFKPALGNGLVTGPVNTWKNHRRVMGPNFNRKMLENFVENFEKSSKSLVAQMEKFSAKGCFDAHPLLHRYTIDIINDTVFDQHLDVYVKDGSVKAPTLIQRLLHIFFTRMTQVWLQNEWVFRLSSYYEDHEKLIAITKKVFNDAISEKRWLYKNQNLIKKTPDGERPILMNYLIELAETTATWTDEDIRSEMITMVSAGSDTFATGIGFVFVTTAMFPSVQNKVYEEIQSIFKGSDRPITKEDLNEMVYMERVIKETYRLLPPAHSVIRAIKQDMQLSTQVIPKGCSCIIGILGTHMDPEIWPEPWKFDPDRFLPEAVAKRPSCAFIPFSTGPRNCIGINYSIVALKVLLATIIRNYTLSTEHKSISEIKLKTTIIQKCAEGTKIKLKPRYI